MKTYLVIGLIGFLSLHAAIPSAVEVTSMPAAPKEDKELAWVDEQIKAILPARVGIADGAINSLRDPMKLAKPAPKTSGGTSLMAPPKLGATTLLPLKPVVVEEPLRLKALMNKSALISEKWYKVGDTVRGYSLAEIKPNSVLLLGKKGQKLILFLTKPNNKIQITTK